METKQTAPTEGVESAIAAAIMKWGNGSYNWILDAPLWGECDRFEGSIQTMFKRISEKHGTITGLRKTGYGNRPKYELFVRQPGKSGVVQVDGAKLQAAARIGDRHA